MLKERQYDNIFDQIKKNLEQEERYNEYHNKGNNQSGKKIVGAIARATELES